MRSNGILRNLVGLGSVVTSLLIVGPPVASALVTFPPDLRTEPFTGIRLCQERLDGDASKSYACTGTGRTVIRFSTRVGDHGAGPLELVPDPSVRLSGCPSDVPADEEVMVDERIYRDKNGDGVFERGTDTGHTDHVAGCKYYHAAHHHYHFDDYASYSLYAEATGQLVSGGTKTSFCLTDSGNFDISLPGAPQQPYYSSSTCGSLTGIDGTSVGWFDTYGPTLPGQELDVTALPSGDYCLVTIADPDNRLIESNDGNNTRKVRIHLDPSQAPVNSYISVQKLKAPCTAGP